MSKVREEKAGWVARAFSISDRVGELPSRGFALVRVNCEGWGHERQKAKADRCPIKTAMHSL